MAVRKKRTKAQNAAIYQRRKLKAQQEYFTGYAQKRKAQKNPKLAINDPLVRKLVNRLNRSKFDFEQASGGIIAADTDEFWEYWDTPEYWQTLRDMYEHNGIWAG